MMDQIDVKVYALITAGVLVAVQILKKIVPKLMEGREEVIAMVLPILFTVIAKAAHAFHATPWVDALLWSLGGGVSAGIAHDKVMNPVMDFVKGLFSKSSSDAPPSEPPKQ